MDSPYWPPGSPVRIAPDFERLRIALYGSRLSLVGNMDLGSTLTLGPLAQVRAAAHDLVRTIGPGGGYCLGSSNTVTNYVPLAIFHAMVEADLAYGHYPLDRASGYETGGDQETPC